MENNTTQPNFVDTSTPAFSQQFKPGDNDFYGDSSYENSLYGDTNEDLNNESQENNITDDNDWQDLDNQQQANNDDYTSGNNILDSYVEWASTNNIDISELELDPNDFTQDDMDYLVGRHYTQKYLGNVDPRIVDLAENGVDLDEYMQHKNYLNSLANTDPIQLYKASMYDFIKESEAKLGTIELDNNGNPVHQDHQQYLINEVERRIKNASQDELINKGKQIQEYYKQQINELPNHLVEQQRNLYTKQVQSYNAEVNELVEIFKNKLSATDNLIVDFSGQAEKDDYIKFMQSNLVMQEVNGEQVVPLLHKLQNDADFLANTVRLLHMHEKGYFTDLKNKERNAAFRNLSITPVLNKNTKISKNVGAGKYADTSDPTYQKQFKRY
jgi:hypothetical protein